MKKLLKCLDIDIVQAHTTELQNIMSIQHYINEPLTRAEMDCLRAVETVIKKNPGLKITQQMIAKQLKKKQPTISKQLGSLEDKGKISTKDGEYRSIQIVKRVRSSKKSA